jgi:hypothetical protein
MSSSLTVRLLLVSSSSPPVSDHPRWSGDEKEDEVEKTGERKKRVRGESEFGGWVAASEHHPS